MKIIYYLLFALSVSTASGWARSYSKTYHAPLWQVLRDARLEVSGWRDVGFAHSIRVTSRTIDFATKAGRMTIALSPDAKHAAYTRAVVTGPSRNAKALLGIIGGQVHTDQQQERNAGKDAYRQERRAQKAALQREREREFIASLTMVRADGYRVVPRVETTSVSEPENTLDCTSDGDWDGYEIDFTCDNTTPPPQTYTTEYRDIYEALATRDGRRYVARCEYMAASSDPTAPMAQAAVNLGAMLGALLLGQRPTVPVCAALNVRGYYLAEIRGNNFSVIYYWDGQAWESFRSLPTYEVVGESSANVIPATVWPKSPQ